MSAVEPAATASLAERLGSVRVGLREDLNTTRHVFRGKPSYVVTDSIAFNSHRFDPAEYELLTSIESSRPLSQIFDALVERKRLNREDETSFYEFVFLLHRLGFLSLPVSDDKLLYRRYKARKQASRRGKILGFLFLQIPVWNPDAFLNKTIHYARPLFGRTFFIFWVFLMVMAGGVVATHWTELWQPLTGLLAARNLMLMWCTLIGLKVIHEFGHAYACKHYGTHVPDMGIFLIAFTPFAYVDATATWTLTNRWKRVVVCLAGMYFESIIAALAVFVWALTGPSFLHAFAYNVMFLAGIITVLFNFNPLMRYDGYYILSDVLDIPNLRGRANQRLRDVAKRLALGIRPTADAEEVGSKRTLLAFGIAGTLYRVLVLVGIAALVASKLFLVGLLLAGVFLGSSVVGMLRRLAGYLWYADETAHVRLRAVAISLLLFVGVPLGLTLIPVQLDITVAGLVTAEYETVVHAQTAGFVRSTAIERGDLVAAGDALVELDNDRLREDIADVQARFDASLIRGEAYAVDHPAKASSEAGRRMALTRELDAQRAQLASLNVTAPLDGRIVECIAQRATGVFVDAGDALLTIASGGHEVRTLLTEAQLAAVEPRVGDVIEFRAAADAAATLGGRIMRIQPGSARRVEHLSLTHLGGGDIVVDPLSGEASQPYFVVTITLEPRAADALRRGQTGLVRLPARPEPIALHVYRRIAAFVTSVRQG